MGLARLGLEPDAEAVYRAMLTAPRSGVPGLARNLGWPEPRVRAAVTGLMGLSLIRDSWEDPESLVLVRPDAGLNTLLHHHEHDLLERQREIAEARAEITRLVAEYDLGRTRRSSGDVEFVSGIDAIRLRIQQLAGECGESVWAFNAGGAQTEANLGASRPLDLEVLARGVELRDVYLESAFNDQATGRHIRALVEAGARARTVPVLPLRLLLYDRRIAMIPGDPEPGAPAALVVDGTGIVTGMTKLFELVWESATPVGAERVPDADGLSDRERAIVLLLADGRTDEAIARELALSVRTARRDIAELMRRAGAGSRFQAGVRMAELGWLKPD